LVESKNRIECFDRRCLLCSLRIWYLQIWSGVQ